MVEAPLTSTGLRYHPASLVPSFITSSIFSPFATPTRGGSGTGARGAGNASRSWNSHATATRTTYEKTRPSATRRMSTGRICTGAACRARTRRFAIARGAPTANLTCRDHPADYLPGVSCGDSHALAVLPPVRQPLADRHHQRAGRRRAAARVGPDGRADRQIGRAHV